MRPQAEPPKPPPPQEHPQAALALLLHQTTLERDEARQHWDTWKDRAERAEGLLLRLDAQQSPHSANSAHHTMSNGPQDTKLSPPSIALLLQMQAQLDATKAALAKSESRFRAVFDAWDNFEKWQIECERRVLDARVNIRSVISTLCDPVHNHEFASDPNNGYPKPPFPVHHRFPSGTHGKPSPLTAGFPSLPPPPSVGPSRVRSRTESVDSERAAKRHRPDEGASPASADHSALMRQRPPSPSNIPALHLPVPPVVSGRAHLSAHTRNNMLPPVHAQRGFGAETPEGPLLPRPVTSDTSGEITPAQLHASGRARGSGSTHSRENSGNNLGELVASVRRASGASGGVGDDDAASDSGNSIDEMILEASSLQPGAPHQRVNSRGGSSHPGDGPEGAVLNTSPGQAGPSSNSGAAFSASLSGKKAKGNQHRAEPIEAPSNIVYPATNDQGQRTCRQCGQAGRYKDGKCVEKWGPGPLGPGTVCDRCRKKMKRIERRGQADAVFQSALLANIASHTQSATAATASSSKAGAKKNPATDSDSEDFPSAYPREQDSKSNSNHKSKGAASLAAGNADASEGDADADGVADADGDAETDADADGERILGMGNGNGHSGSNGLSMGNGGLSTSDLLSMELDELDP